MPAKGYSIIWRIGDDAMPNSQKFYSAATVGVLAEIARIAVLEVLQV